jgi:hypothetical protein
MKRTLRVGKTEKFDGLADLNPESTNSTPTNRPQGTFSKSAKPNCKNRVHECVTKPNQHGTKTQTNRLRAFEQGAGQTIKPQK